MVAKNLCTAPLTPMLYRTPLFPYDYKDWQSNHIWLHKPPLALWLMSGSLTLFGINEPALRFPSIFLSTLQTLLVYSIARRLFCPKIGLTAALFHAVNPLLLRLATGRESVDHVDTALVFFVTLAIWLAVVSVERPTFARLFATGLATGLALLAKSLPALLVCPVLLALAWRPLGWRRAGGAAALVAITALLVAAPWNLYAALKFPREQRWEQTYNLLHLTEPVEDTAGGIFFHVLRLPYSFHELVWIPLAWLFVQAVRNPAPARLGLAVWFGLPLLAFSLAASKRANYMAIAAPAVCIIMAYYWWCLRTPLRPPRQPYLWAAFCALLVLLPLKGALHFINPFRAAHRTPAWAVHLRNLSSQISDPRSVLFNIDRPIEAMFYNDCTAYSLIPTAADIARLTEGGWRVYILNTPQVPPALWLLPGVTPLPAAP